MLLCAFKLIFRCLCVFLYYCFGTVCDYVSVVVIVVVV